MSVSLEHFSFCLVRKKTEEGGGEGNKEEEHHRHQLSINQLKKPPCLVIALVYDDMSSRSAH
jgi:hypothetical protein